MVVSFLVRCRGLRILGIEGAGYLVLQGLIGMVGESSMSRKMCGCRGAK